MNWRYILIISLNAAYLDIYLNELIIYPIHLEISLNKDLIPIMLALNMVAITRSKGNTFLNKCFWMKIHSHVLEHKIDSNIHIDEERFVGMLPLATTDAL